MPSSLKQFRAQALARPEVRKAYDDLAEEFAFLDEVLKARAESGLTQAEVAALVGTTQSAIARLESATPKHSPSITTLQRYAKAIGYKVEIRLVKEEPQLPSSSSRRNSGPAARRSPQPAQPQPRRPRSGRT
ncbi:MAG TPA: helix-turn-helix transcriptional regulator [Thermoanaerobaculia bacterium]|nr:helix-turn-helix transcriptional regulator [Thermoanaerobaculia bacterium]